MRKGGQTGYLSAHLALVPGCRGIPGRGTSPLWWVRDWLQPGPEQGCSLAHCQAGRGWAPGRGDQAATTLSPPDWVWPGTLAWPPGWPGKAAERREGREGAQQWLLPGLSSSQPQPPPVLSLSPASSSVSGSHPEGASSPADLCWCSPWGEEEEGGLAPPAMWPWARYAASLRLSFPICKIGIIIP